MSDRLLIPLNLLPGPVPVGAPGVMPDGEEVIIQWAAPDRLVVAGSDRALHPHAYQPSSVALDLSPPPVDAAGYPLRIDGAQVAAEMLARAMGLWAGGGEWRNLQWLSWHGGGWRLAVGRLAVYFYPVPHPAIEAHHVPALADIDPANPLADRLALAAVLQARPWRTDA